MTDEQLAEIDARLEDGRRVLYTDIRALLDEVGRLREIEAEYNALVDVP